MNAPISRIFAFLLVFVFSQPTMQGQLLHESVFKDLRDQQLFDSLVKNYKTYSLLPYSTCRDTMFSKIDAVNDSLECIYTGMKRYLPPGADPTDAVLLNGQPNGINTEHAYPQSKGASGYGRSDMHILYPSRVKTNTNRLNNPFAEIPDQQTSIWYYLTNEQTFPPVVNRDAYSESTSTLFEPRESVKGNIARSVFYFYTLYRNDAVNADPNFFNLQVNDLCAWHYLDPVDSTEWVRNQKFNSYQGNLNPFVLDCSLASRLYCPTLSDACEKLVFVKEDNTERVKLFPNPGNGIIQVTHPHHNHPFSVSVINMFGINVFNISGISSGNTSEFELNSLPPGMYLLYYHDLTRNDAEVFKYILTP